MNKLNVSFGGLNLKNPFIVSSSSLTSSAAKNKKWEEAGAAAVVLKSLFEEEIEAETAEMQSGAHTEEQDYLLAYHRAHRLEEYLKLIRESKAVCTIPVIASINCYRNADWTAFAKSMEEAGADAIEINIMSIRNELEYEAGSFEKQHVEILRSIKAAVNVPVIVKLGSHFTNCMPLINQLTVNGAAGIVLFNRMVTPDIDIDKMTYTMNESSNRSDLGEVIRWTGLASARVPKANLLASGGVNEGKDLVKVILAGATAAEVCSTLYKNGSAKIQEMLDFLDTWMTKQGYKSVEEMRGLMNAKKSKSIDTFERTQFFKNYSLREE